MLYAKRWLQCLAIAHIIGGLMLPVVVQLEIAQPYFRVFTVFSRYFWPNDCQLGRAILGGSHSVFCNSNQGCLVVNDFSQCCLGGI